MSSHCQFNDCLNEVTHECILNNKRTFLCHKDLLKLLASGTPAQLVKSVNLSFPDEQKSILINYLTKKMKDAIDFRTSFLEMNMKLIKEITQEQDLVLQNVNKILKHLGKAVKLVYTTEKAKTYEVLSPLVKLLLVSKEELLLKLGNLDLFQIDFYKKTGLNSAKITNNIKKYLNKNIDNKEGVCPNGHPLLLSFDTDSFYKFLNNDSKGLVLCGSCKTVLNSNSFHCRKCRFDLCDPCREANEFTPISFPTCSKGHQLEILQNANKKFSYVCCDSCNEEINKNSWRCGICDFDNCETCTKKKGIQSLFEYPLECKKKHRMVLGFEESNFNCELCSLSNKTGNHWKCDKCNVKFCSFCVEELGLKSPVCPKMHEMVNSSEKKKGFFKLGGKKCFKCNGGVGDFGYSCRICDANLCDGCFKEHPFVFYMKQG